MAYYPIKCPYCLRVHTNETVRFNLREAIVVSTRSVARAQNEAAPGAQDEQADYYSGGDGWLDDDFDSAPQQQSPSARTGKLPTEGLFTLAELISRFGQENVVAEYKQVNALPALTTADFGGDLLQHVTLTYVENGTETVKRVMDRYCDCDAERPKRLNTSSGSVASYVVLLMGSSNSGKTMYLISLFRALTQAGGFPMPPTGTVAKLSIQVLSEGDSETSIESMSDRLFEEGELPKTTIAMTNEPLTLDITVMFQNNVKKKAMLFLRDMPGEYLTNRERDQEIQRIANQFPYFDGFMIMFDPLTFAENVFPAGLNDKEQRRQIDRLRQVILSRVVPMMRDNVISQPTAALITKGDYFFDERYGGALRNKGVVLARHVLPNLQESFDQQYFAKVSAGARDIVKLLSPNILELISTNFNNAFFALSSSLSRRPIAIDNANGRVETPTAISPWRIAEPMIRLLMKMYIIPPFELINVMPPAGESAEQRNARRALNRSVLNAWGNSYCTGWIDFAG